MEDGLENIHFVRETLSDLRRRLKEVENEPIAICMHDEESRVSPDTPLLEALRMLYLTRASLPVVDPESGRLLGMISYFDVGEKILNAPLWHGRRHRYTTGHIRMGSDLVRRQPLHPQLPADHERTAEPGHRRHARGGVHGVRWHSHPASGHRGHRLQHPGVAHRDDDHRRHHPPVRHLRVPRHLVGEAGERRSLVDTGGPGAGDRSALRAAGQCHHCPADRAGYPADHRRAEDHRLSLSLRRDLRRQRKRVFDLVKDFGTSESPKSTRSSTTHWCPGRPGHPAFRHNIASSLRLHTGLPYDWTPRSDAPLGSPLAPSARRVSRVASRLPGTTRLRFALHGGQRGRHGNTHRRSAQHHDRVRRRTGVQRLHLQPDPAGAAVAARHCRWLPKPAHKWRRNQPGVFFPSRYQRGQVTTSG